LNPWCKLRQESLRRELWQGPSSYFTLLAKQLAPGEDAYFDEKALPPITENYKRKGAKVEFRA
jgi:hypothetical protein